MWIHKAGDITICSKCKQAHFHDSNDFVEVQGLVGVACRVCENPPPQTAEPRMQDIVGYYYIIAGKSLAFCLGCTLGHSPDWLQGMTPMRTTDKIKWHYKCEKCGKKIHDN